MLDWTLSLAGLCSPPDWIGLFPQAWLDSSAGWTGLDWTLRLVGLDSFKDWIGLFCWLDWTLSQVRWDSSAGWTWHFPRLDWTRLTGLDPGRSLCCRLHSPLTELDNYSTVDGNSNLDIVCRMPQWKFVVCCPWFSRTVHQLDSNLLLNKILGNT